MRGLKFSRQYWLVLGMMIFGVIAILRVAQLQLVQGFAYRTLADENRFFTRYIPPSRGVFLDRYNTVLVHNAPQYKMATQETLGRAYPEFIEVEERTALEQLSRDEKNIVIDQKRTYPFGAALSPVLGYVGDVSIEELRARPEYHAGQTIGKAGLERVLQSQLAGRSGKEVFEMHATGKLLRQVAREPASPGVDVKLTIDASFSARAYALLGERKGAIVASNPKTGEVYALVSSPSYDATQIGKAITDEDKPMLNRALVGMYPPGSVFKLITALAGLQTNAFTTETKVKDEGVLKVGEYQYGNWYFSQYGRTEGEVSVVKALQRSNDIFFYKAAEWIGPDVLARFARLFKYGTRTGIELSGESSGLVPDSAWKKEAMQEQWYLGDTYHMGIGQGNVLVTPLQVNTVTAALANDGVWCQPRLLTSSPTQCEDLGVSLEYIGIVREGMKAACATGGTAFPFFDGKPVEVACKTGTAEIGEKDEKGRRRTHGWLTLMAPAEHPEIAMTVLLESSDAHQFVEGSRDAGPIAKELVKEWMGRK